MSGLASCVRYQPLPLDLEKQRSVQEARSLDDTLRPESSPAGVAAGTGWGRANLLEAGLKYNTGVAEARSVLAQAAAAQTSARAFQNPTISLGSEYDLSKVAESPWLWSFASSLLLDMFAIRDVQIDLANAGLRAASADFQEAIWNLRKEIRDALLSSVIAEQREALQELVVAQRRQLMVLEQARFNEGASGRADGLQSALELARAQAGLNDAQAEAIAQRARLAAAIGVSSRALDGVRLQFEELEAPPVLSQSRLAQLEEEALLSRPELRRAIAEYDSRELELKKQSGAQYLQLAMGPGYTYDHGVQKLTVGASLSLPVFNRNQGPIAEAVAARDTAGRHAESVQASIIAEIATAAAAYSNSLKSLATAGAQRQIADSILQQVRSAFDLHGADREALLIAQIGLATARIAEIDALDRSQRSLGVLEDAVRRPLSGPEPEIFPVANKDSGAGK